MIYCHPFSCAIEQEMNELTKVLLFKGVYVVKFVFSSASLYVVFQRIKFPYPNYFMIVDFWIDSFRLICLVMTKVPNLSSSAHVQGRKLRLFETIAFLALSHYSEHYIRRWCGCIKWCEIYVAFNSFLLFDLRIKVTLPRKNSIKFDDYVPV